MIYPRRFSGSIMTVLIAAALVFAASPIMRQEDAGPTPMPLATRALDASEAACETAQDADFTLASQPQELFTTAAAQPCKNCKDRTWCHCSYNGLPRVSCNPCCYGNLGIPQVCLD